MASDEQENEVFLSPPYDDTNVKLNGAQYLLSVPSDDSFKSPLRSSLIKEGTRRNSPARKTVSFSSTPQEKKVSNVADCLKHMQNGADLTKVRANGRQYRRHFSLDADDSNLRWTPTNKKPHKAKIPVDSIKEIRVGRNTEVLRSVDNCFNDMQEECAFSVIYGDDYECLDLVASHAEEANIWVTGLMALTCGHKPDCAPSGSGPTSPQPCANLRERWLEQVYEEADADTKGFLNEKSIVRLVKTLNPRLLASRVKLKIKEIDSHKAEEERGRINKKEFLELYKDVATRPEVYFLMVRYANKDYLTCEDLQMFLETEQGMTSVTQDLCVNIIQRYEPSAEARANDFMTVDGFTSYLLSEECTLFDAVHRSVCQDMNRPFSQYFVASSNNTYLVEDQLKGPSAVDGYISALKRGCRLVELDVWEQEDGGEPVVYHGHTLTSKLPLTKALIAIKEFAFETSEYPLIIKIEQHLGLTEQRFLAAKLKDMLGLKLYIPSKDDDFALPPTPDGMRGKILLMGKKLKSDTEDEGEVTEEDESSETNRSRVSKRHHDRKVVLCKQLSDLISPFFMSNYIKDLQSAFDQLKPGDVANINESHCLRLAHTYPEEFSGLTRQFTTRVYPNAVRVDSSNMNPQEFWNFGIQLVALNYQTPGLMMDLQEGKFLANGGCGYVLKPPMMRDQLAHLASKNKLPMSLTPQILHLKIISGQQLPRPRGSTAKGDSADPFVVIEIFGIPMDCAEERTKTIKNDSFNPAFDESFQFQVSVPEVALVRFLVLDDDYIGDDFIGQYTIPFECLQSGYRHLTLLNNEGEPLENSTLFLHIAVTNRRGGGKPRKRGMSVKRKHQRIHTGVKMIGLKQLDELFKNAVVPLAECIQLRNGLESAMVEWQEVCGLGPAGTMRQGLRLLHSRVLTAALTSGVTAPPPVVEGEDSGTGSDETPPGMDISVDENGYPHVEHKGNMPEQLRKTFTSLETLLGKCQTILDRTDQLLQRLEEATHRIAESYEELSGLCSEAGLRGQKATRATENFAWNLRLLKAQLDLMYRTQQESRNVIQQVTDTGCILNLLREKCVQPCIHQTAPRSPRSVTS